MNGASKYNITESKVDLFLWRPVIAGLCRFTELYQMNVDDLLDMHEILDMQDHMAEIDRMEAEAARGKRS
jgi:hypothetical protein